MEVTIYSMNDPVGVLRHTESGVVCDPPDNPVLRGVLASPLRDPDTKRAVTARSDPKRWLELLPTQYRSPYLWAAAEKKGD